MERSNTDFSYRKKLDLKQKTKKKKRKEDIPRKWLEKIFVRESKIEHRLYGEQGKK